MNDLTATATATATADVSISDAAVARPSCAVCGVSQRSLLACSQCRSVHYCGKPHQTADWKTHKTKCAAMSKQRASAAPTAVVSAALSDYILSAVSRYRALGDGAIERFDAAAAVTALTHALHLHSAIPAEHADVTYLLYAYRATAYLTCDPPLSHLAVYDAITALKANPAYIKSYGVVARAWKCFGNMEKALTALRAGLAAAKEREDTTLAQRFQALINAYEQEQSESAASAHTKTAEPMEVSALNVRTNESRVGHKRLQQFDDAIDTSIRHNVLYRIPTLTQLQRVMIPPPSLAADTRHFISFASLAERYELTRTALAATHFLKGVELRYAAESGRGLYALRAFDKGDIIVNERPLLYGTVRDDCCAVCFASFIMSDGVRTNAILCEGACGYEHYCSTQCRDAAWTHHHQWMCGHSLDELRQRCREAVTASGKVPLLIAQAFGIAIGQIDNQRRNMIAAARRDLEQAATERNVTSPLTSPVDLLSLLPALSLLQSMSDLSTTYLATTKLDFERQWALQTLMLHWLVLNVANKSTDSKPLRPLPNSTLTMNEMKAAAQTHRQRQNAPAPIASSSAAAYIPWFDMTFYDSLHHRLLINAFSFRTGATDKHNAIGGAVSLVGLASSQINHSCFPSAAVDDDAALSKGAIIVRAVRAIKKGEQITLSYIGDVPPSSSALKDTSQHPLASRAARADALLPFGFLCECSRCRRENIEANTDIAHRLKLHGLTPKKPS